MDVDKLFNLPKISSSSLNKRKHAGPSMEAIKAARVDAEAGPSKATTVIVASDEEEEDAFAPGNDADYFIDEDAEGRFFGGGLTEQQKRILSIMSQNDEDGAQPPPEAELSNARKQLLRFERAITKNQEMRVRFASEPAKFIDSEADLDAEIKGLVVLTTNPGLFYPELVKIGSVGSLAGLLSHENVDIAAAAIELLEELTDDDVLDAGEAGEETEWQGTEGMAALLDALLENQILDLLVSNLSRFMAEDADAIYHTLGVVENLVSLRPALAEVLFARTDYLSWTLRHLQSEAAFDQNKAYAAELLAITLQSSESNRAKLGEAGGVDALLSLLAAYRKRGPADADETEYMENLFDALCSVLALEENRERFDKAEGVQLMVLIMKPKTIASLRAVKVLNFALTPNNCATFVECLGLRTLFAAFMRKGTTHEDDEHTLGVIAALFTNLESDTPGRIRLLAKFVEDDYAKVDRLLELRDDFAKKLERVQDEDEFKRLENGLFALQLTDYCLAWACMEDDGVLAHVKMMLERNGLNLDAIIDVLKEYHGTTDDENIQTIIVALVNFLLGA